MASSSGCARERRGNSTSGDKNRSGDPAGPIALRTALTGAAHAAARTKNTYLAGDHAHIRGRGACQKPDATRHHLLACRPRQVDYTKLGPDWAQRRRSTEHRTRRLVHRLQQLSHTVTVHPTPEKWSYGPKLPGWSPDSHLSVTASDNADQIAGGQAPCDFAH